MIKFKKSEVEMKRVKISSLVAAFALGVLGLIGLNNKANAASEITIGDNAKIPVGQEIRSLGSENLTATYSYIIEEIDGKSAVSNLPSPKLVLNEEPFVDNLIERNFEIDLSQVRVRAAPGEYEMKLSCVSDNELFACDSSYYTFTIFVENILDNDQVPIGEMKASIVALRKVIDGTPSASKLDEAYFYSEEQLPPEPVYTYITVKNTVEGDLAKEDDVFKYVITVDGSEDVVYTISAPEGEYIFGGETVESDTIAHGGSTVTIYLRHNETATIGRSEDGENQILVGTGYSIYEYPDIKDYRTWIDSKDAGERVEIRKIAAENPASNHTLYINSRNKPTIPEKIEEFVNTGLKYKNGAFMVLGLLALIAVLVMILQKKKGTK